MEPEIIALARRMFEAYLEPDHGFPPAWMTQAWERFRRAFLRAALVARPDLADVRVEPGHWASGVLGTVGE